MGQNEQTNESADAFPPFSDLIVKLENKQKQSVA